MNSLFIDLLIHSQIHLYNNGLIDFSVIVSVIRHLIRDLYSFLVQLGYQVQLTPTLTDFKESIIFICYRRIFSIADKKKIDKSIDFLRGWEKKMVSIFRLRRCGKVAVSWGLNGAGPKIDT